MTLTRLLMILALVGMVGWLMRPDRTAVVHGPGQIAPQTPRQAAVDGRRPFDHRGYAIEPLARFEARARVLGRERYRFDREADLAPVDLALGWGPMSDERVLDQLTITQGGRWYHWSTREMPVPRRAIETNSANMHMIPKDDTVEAMLERVRPGQVVELRGYLIEARAADGWRWRSSLSREDTGGHACELVFVEHLAIVDAG